MAERPLRIGLVGANWSLEGAGTAWRMLPDTELVAVCTSRQETAEKAASQNGITKAYWDYREMMKDPEIDVVNIAMKPTLRYDIVVSALEAGKHVCQSIPYATDLVKARHMRDLQRSKGLVGVAESQTRWMPAIRCMKDMVDDGYLGELYHAHVNIHLPLIRQGDFVYPLVAWLTGATADSPSDASRLWFGDKESGAGAWRNFAIHSLMVLSYLFGPVEEVTGNIDVKLKEWRLPNGTNLKPTSEDVATVLVRFANGGTAVISTSWSTADASGFLLEAWGSHGRLATRSVFPLGDVSAGLFAGDARPRDYDTIVGQNISIPERYYQVPGLNLEKADAGFYLPFMLMFSDMRRAIRDGGDSSPSFNEAYQAHLGMEAAVRSVDTRSWVRIADLDKELD
jgi:predicted dehydrogenase